MGTAQGRKRPGDASAESALFYWMMPPHGRVGPWPWQGLTAANWNIFHTTAAPSPVIHGHIYHYCQTPFLHTFFHPHYNKAHVLLFCFCFFTVWACADFMSCWSYPLTHIHGNCVVVWCQFFHWVVSFLAFMKIGVKLAWWHPPTSRPVWQRPCQSKEICDRWAGVYAKCHQML